MMVKFSVSVLSPLPHGQRSDTDEVCLFTKDEPRMTAEQTQRFYKKLLEERGVTNVSEVLQELQAKVSTPSPGFSN